MALNDIEVSEGVGTNIATHLITEGGVDRHIERIAPASGQLGAWDDDAAGVSAIGLVSNFSVSTIGKGRIILGAKCQTTADYFYSGFLVFKNSAGDIVGVSATVAPAFKVLDDGGSPAKKFAAIQVFANECGASSAEFYLTALPSGASSIDLYLAAI